MTRPPLLLLLICLLAAAAPPPDLRAATDFALRQPSGPLAIGLNTHLATRYPDAARMDEPAAIVAELGVRWAREDLHWHRVQPRPDTWDWAFTDNALRALLRRDIQILGVLGPAVGWATPDPGDRPDLVSYSAPDETAFVAYATAVVARYKNYVKHWEIWNEPDQAIFWRPAPDPAAYTRLLIRTAAAIRAIDPTATILVGGTNPFDTTFLRTVAEQGGWGSFDVIAIHPYVDPYSPEDGNLIAAADGVRALAERYGRKPIWATEMGWASGPGDRDALGLTSADQQAAYLARAYLALWQGGVSHVFWYMLKDDAHNPYGLFAYGAGRADFRTRKPAFAALQTLARALDGARFVERRDLFERAVALDFEQAAGWARPSQPNGSLAISGAQAAAGARSAEVRYRFTTRENDYVAFARERPLPLPGAPHAIGIWVYGDGSAHGVKVWLRDAEGELLQFVLGAIGPPGWHFISAPIGGPVEPGNQLEGAGNRRLDFPASLEALVIDDAVDSQTGTGTIYLDNLSAISGPEVYDLRLQRGDASLDILWSPPGARVRLATQAASGRLVGLAGSESDLPAEAGMLRVSLGPAPVFLWHRR